MPSELRKGSQQLALTTKEVTAVLTIRDALDAYRRETGRVVTALQAVSGYLDAAKPLPDGHNLGEAVRGYLGIVAVVQRKPLAKAPWHRPPVGIPRRPPGQSGLEPP